MKKIFILCVLIAGISLIFQLTFDKDIHTKNATESKKDMLIDAKVENISFYDDYLWIDIEWNGKNCAIYAKDTVFKNEHCFPMDPKDIKVGQYIEACVSTEVTYEPVTTFNSYVIWSRDK